MARTPSITAEQVAEAAETLLQRGETPSVRRVREMLGTGSNATVQALLHTWTAQQPAADTPQVAMSEGLAQAVKAELELLEPRAKLADDLQARVAVLEAQAAKGGKISP